ncbi:hypothetical protein CCH79_00007376, partial [Gambusia affinis]
MTALIKTTTACSQREEDGSLANGKCCTRNSSHIALAQHPTKQTQTGVKNTAAALGIGLVEGSLAHVLLP